VRKRARGRAVELLGQEPVLEDASANYFGRTSKSRFQLRGNGCLALGPERLVFVMWWPRRELVIERDSITGVDTTKVHLGKTVGRPLLRVTFGDESAAWLVRELNQWPAALA
jgi:hypothetical protein